MWMPLPIVFLLWVAAAHDFGLHGLSGENPSGDPLPLVPEITGPFQVNLMLRINTISSPYHAIFHWTDEASSPTPSSVLFAYGQSGFGLWIDDPSNGNIVCLATGNAMMAGDDLYKVEFSADGTTLRAAVDGVETASCASSIVPSAATRVHYLAESPNVTSSPDIDIFQGAILGIMVVNTNDPPAHPKDLYRFWSFPSQVLGSTPPTGLAASAYVRFDSVASSWRQRFFDFGNGPNSNNILCAQVDATDTMRCRVFYGVAPNGAESIRTTIELAGSIVENEWAFWHFEIHQNTSFSIQKDNDVPEILDTTGGFPFGIFRTNSYIGRGNWLGPQNLHGIVLGFRLDVS